MDNKKTGALIAERRRALGLTQAALAERLHVTDKAVSKWERGLCAPGVDLLMPLSEVLGVSVTELLTGEVIAPPAREAAAEAVAVESLTAAARMRRRARTIVGLCGGLLVALLLVQIFVSYAPAIFQRGNPLPYLAAAMTLDADTPYAPVEGEPGVYIARLGACPALFAEVEERYGVTFYEQAGSGYIFANGERRVVISSEVYFGRYTVWTTPTATPAATVEP